MDPGFRTVEVAVGRVGGLFRTLPLVPVRDAGVVVLEVGVELTGRFVVVELDRGRLVVVDVVGFFAGDAGDAFSFPASGLVTTSDFDSSGSRVESIGVAGGASSVPSGGVETGSSVEAMVRDLMGCTFCHSNRIEIVNGAYSVEVFGSPWIGSLNQHLSLKR